MRRKHLTKSKFPNLGNIRNSRPIPNHDKSNLQLRIIGIEESEDSQLKELVNIFNKIVEENFPNPKKEMPINLQEAYRTPNRLFGLL